MDICDTAPDFDAATNTIPYSREADEDGDQIPHLLSPVMSSRQALAAHFLRACDHIIELGGYKAPITPFLTHGPKSVLSVDPKMAPFEAEQLHGKPCRVRHVAAKFQRMEFDIEPDEYGLAILGYSLKGYGDRNPDDEVLFELVDKARVTVIDHAVGFERAQSQLPAVLGRGTVQEICRIDSTLHDEMISGSPYAHRRLRVFEPANS